MERRVIANTQSPLIEAVLKQSFRFTNLTDAVAKIAFLKNHFILTSGFMPDSPEDAVLWIKGYALTESETEEGRTGNFARVTWGEAEKGRFTLIAEKLDIPVKEHPQRKNLNHPDWGYYLFRHSRKGQRYTTLEEANNELQRLTDEYPKACVLATNKLHVQVYRKKGEGESALEPMTLEITTAREGGFIITSTPNACASAPKICKPKQVRGSFSARMMKQP